MALARWVVFALVAFVMNFPVVATFVTSIKGDSEIASNPSLSPTLGNYAAIFGYGGPLRHNALPDEQHSRGAA